MATTLDDGKTFDRSPTVKLKNVGEQIVGMIVDKREAPLYKFGTKEVEKDDKGNDRTQDIVTVIVLDGTTATVVDNTDGNKVERAAKVGEVAAVFIAKQARFAFYEAKNKLGGSLKVSDILRVRLDDKKDVGKGNPQSVYSVALRRAKADESGLADRAEAEHKRQKGIELEPSTAAPAAPVGSYEDDF